MERKQVRSSCRLRVEDDLGADDRPQPGVAGRRMHPRSAVDPVGVHHGQRLQPELGSTLHHVFGLRGAIEE